MKNPKSILIVHRASCDWLNKRLVPLMRKKYSCRFTIVSGHPVKEFSKRSWVSSEDFVISLNDLQEEALAQVNDKNEIFKNARHYEEKYNITYLRDAFSQFRMVALKFLHSLSKQPLSYGKPPIIEDLTKELNYYINYFESHFTKFNIDMVICRPDEPIGFSANIIAKNNNIPATFHTVTRVDGYVYWPDGPYSGYRQLQLMANKIKNDSSYVVDEKIEKHNKIGSHALVERRVQLDALSFKVMAGSVIWTLKDRLNWLLQDIKRGKLGKRVPVIPKILSIINKHRDHRYFQKIFESDIKKIESKPFVYFPLPMEPEYYTHSLSKEFLNIHAMVQQAALSLPSGYNLVIKEHTPNIGLKSRDFYKSLMKIPNVIFANYLFTGPEIIDRAETLITIVGTAALEAAERGKMAIVLGTSIEYIYLPNIILGHSMRDFPEIIKKALSPVSEKKKKEIKYEYKLLREAYKECGFYAPNTPLFTGNSTEINDNELNKAVKLLIDLYNLQKEENVL